LAPDEYAGFSMTLLRMLAFRPNLGIGIGIGIGIGSGSAPAQSVAAPAIAPKPDARTAARMPAAAHPAPASATAKPGRNPAMAALHAARSGSKPAAVAGASRPGASSSTNVSMSIGSAPPWDEDDLPPSPMASPSGFSGAAAQKKTESPASTVLPAAAAIAAAALPSSPASPAVALELHPLPALGWDGNWPLLAAALPIRGVVQQLALQSELVDAVGDGDGTVLHLRVPMATLLSSGSVDKLTAAVSAHFGQPLRVTAEIGAVVHTASAQARAAQAERQRQAEATIENDPFVQTLMREFGAAVVPGSIKPISIKPQGE
ncbi:MAG: DNA polymerase III subunit gamma/tau C-terminal domain-containing protein, partial [Oxalobacteraceae bacterium]